MPDLSHPVGSVAGQPLALYDVLRGLHLRGRLLPLLHEAAVEQLLLQYAAREALTATDAELQQAANRFRQQRGLAGGEQTRAWLARAGLSATDFEAGLERALLLAKLREHLTAAAIPRQFAAQGARYARARLRQLVVASEGAARELLNQINEDGRAFADLARHHSLHLPSRSAGGDLGSILLCTLPGAVAQRVFAARPGDVVGPVQGEGGFFLFEVQELLPPELDEDTTEFIRAELFEAWLRDRLKDVQLDTAWLGQADASA